MLATWPTHTTNLCLSWDLHLDPQAHRVPSLSPWPGPCDQRHLRQGASCRAQRLPASQARTLAVTENSAPCEICALLVGMRCSRHESRSSGRGNAFCFLGRWGMKDSVSRQGDLGMYCISCSTWAWLLRGLNLQGCWLAGEMKVDRSEVPLFRPARKSVRRWAFVGCLL